MESASARQQRARTRERSEHETEFARIVAFTDGVLAIAITLLVLNLDAPIVPEDELLKDLLKLWPALLAYAISFAVIGRFWVVHHRFFGTLARFDGWLIGCNLLYLSLLVLVPFTSELLGDYGAQAEAAIVYAAIMASAGVVNWLMIRHAMTHDLVKPHERAETARFADRGALLVPLVFFVSIPVALVSPLAAELSWMLALVAHQRERLRPSRRGRARGSGTPS